MMDIKNQGIQDYLADESNIFKADPESISGVYFPESHDDIVLLMRNASASKTRVTVSGGGTGLTGARVPMHGGMIISMERMLIPASRPGYEEIEFNAAAGKARIFLDRETMRAVIPPGITLADLSSALPPGIFYPPDPTEQSAQLGGNVMTNASGARSFFYGPTRAWVEGLKIVLADGDFLWVNRGGTFADEHGIIDITTESGRKIELAIPDYEMPEVKNASGLYTKPGMDMIDLIIGSEGILGIVTEIEIKLAQAPGGMLSDICFFSDEDDALDFVCWLRPLKDKGILSIEYFNPSALDFIREEFSRIRPEARAGVIIEFINSEEMLDSVKILLEQNNSIEDWCAVSTIDKKDLKEFRHAFPDRVNAYIKAMGTRKLGTDFAVPPYNFQTMLAAYIRAGENFKARYPREGVHYTLYGHIGDHHIHFNFLTQNNEEYEYASSLYGELAKLAVELGGTVSAEHGVGKKRVFVNGCEIPYLQVMYGEAGLREIALVKKALDPQWILNTGNMVPQNY